jgi:hypothetical protein
MGMKASYLGGFNRAYVARPIALRRLPVVKKAEFVGNHFYDHFFSLLARCARTVLPAIGPISGRPKQAK